MAEPPTFPMARSRPLVVLLAIVLVPVVASFDYLAGPEFGFSLFYLIPVMLVAGVGGWTSAWFTAVLAALAWMTIDVLVEDYSNILAPLWNTVTRFTFFSLALLVARNNRAKLASAQLKAFSDPLTGLANREYLHVMMNAARARLERYGTPLTLAYVDLDDFKRINDAYGHAAGDTLLQRIAQVLVEHVRDTDTVARVGGDEFLMLLTDAQTDTARPILERMREGLQEITTPANAPVRVSIGACTFYRPLESIEAMIRKADERMYQVKRSGKNSVIIDEIH